MSRQEIMELVAEWFGVDNCASDGTFDIRSYNWQAGCYVGCHDGHEKWMNLAEVVYLIEDIVERIKDGEIDIDEEEML